MRRRRPVAAHGQRPGAAGLLQYGQPRERPDTKPEVLTPEINPFPVKYGTRATKMFFNFSEYGHLLTSEFFAARRQDRDPRFPLAPTSWRICRKR